jgi:hypothetical protein
VIDRGTIGEVAARLMDRVDDELDDNTDAQVRLVLVAVEIDTGEQTETFWHTAPDGSNVITAGLAAQIYAGATAGDPID